MSVFSRRLHSLPGAEPLDEPLVDILDEDEARELARMRLLLTRDFSRVELRRGDRPVDVFARDGG